MKTAPEILNTIIQRMGFDVKDFVFYDTTIAAMEEYGNQKSKETDELQSWKKTAEQAQDLWRKYEAQLSVANRRIDYLEQRIAYISKVLKIDND